MVTMSIFRPFASLFLVIASTVVGCAAPTPPSAPTEQASASVSSGESAAAKGHVVAILTKADWCSVCQANGARVGALLQKGVQEGRYDLVVNDITSDETTAKADAVLTSKGLKELSTGAAPGTITFVDAHTRRAIAGATVAHKDEEIAALTKLAQKRAGAP